MRIEVLADDRISQQARTYAEYRVFAALMQCRQTERFRHARVVLRGVTGADCGMRVACSVAIQLNDSDRVRVRTTSTHACGAIDRAAECILRSSHHQVTIDPSRSS